MIMPASACCGFILLAAAPALHVHPARAALIPLQSPLQTMMGKQFGGDAFMSAPPAAVFEDFEVGNTYQVKLSVINKSYAKNSFRYIP